MLPMGIPPPRRAGYGAVRCIGLTPPHVSSNEVLHYIIPDLVKCCTTGVQGVDPEGNAVTIFLDVLGFIGDYPAVSHVLDVLGHNSRAPCHLCCFVRQDRIGHGSLPYYGHTTDIHSKSSAFCRSVQRMRSLRGEDCSSQDLVELGFKPTFNVSDCPLHALSDALSQARGRVPLTDQNIPVISASLDPYRSSLVAPDHLLFGLAQDVLRATISLCTPQARKIADMLMIRSLSSNKLGKQRQIVNPASASINSMGMSDLFAVLLIAPVCFESALHLDEVTRQERTPSTEITPIIGGSPNKKRRVSCARQAMPPSSPSTKTISSPGRNAAKKTVTCTEILELLKMFQRLVRETHFWPNAILDGTTCVDEFNMFNGKGRLDTLHSLSVEYISFLHSLCVRDNIVVGKYLNKPNVHRLLELYTHTIPAFGHCKHIQELLFETAHQPLKRAIARSNQRSPHVHAVSAALANDWECRLSIEVSSCGDPDSWTPQDCMRLQGLIAGREYAWLGGPDAIRAAFPKPVLSQLAKVRRTLSSGTSDLVVWRLHFQEAVREDIDESWKRFSTENRDIFEEAIISIKNSPARRSFEAMTLQVASSASSWHQHDKLNYIRRRFGNISAGSVVQALVKEDGYPGREEENVKELDTPISKTEVHSTDYRVTFWFILGFFEARYRSLGANNRAVEEGDSFPYAVVKPCSGMDSVPVNDPVRVDIGSKAYVLPLAQSVRETMCVHACAHAAEGCQVLQDKVHHSGLLGQGTPFYIFGRREGYPPRTG